MKKDALLHLLPVLIIFAFASIFRGWTNDLQYIYFWLGGLIGAFLPDVDHLIYVYAMRPQELNSQRVSSLIARKDIKKAVTLLSITREDRSKLIFHTAFFQVLFIAFSYFVVTSSGSFLGRGIVVAFLIHLLIDQFMEFSKTNSLERWFIDLPLQFNRERYLFYWLAQVMAVVLLTLYF